MPGTSAVLEQESTLLRRPLTAVLTTVAPDGRLQVTPVWFGYDGAQLVVSTMREFAKARNMAARPVATLLVIDPADTTSWVEVRARVRLDELGAADLLDDIGEHYTARRPYFGQVVPAELAAGEHPVTCRLEPISVRTPPPVPAPTSRVAASAPPEIEAPDLRPATGCQDDAALPVDHLDLLDAPLVAALATMLPSGLPQTQPVWFTRDDGDLLVNTTLQRRKGRNLLADPRATLLVIDPDDSSRWTEIRADVDLSTVDADEQLDAVTRTYTAHRHYYGGIYPVGQRALETRVVARLHPRVVHCDAVHR